MTAKPINEMKIRLDRAVPNPLEAVVPDHLFMLPGVFAYVAKRNCGKTTAMHSLLRDYKEANLAHRVFLISPNAHSAVNKSLFDGLVEPDDCYTEPSWTSFNAVIKKIELEGADWKRYQKDKADYEALHRALDSGNDIIGMPEELLVQAHTLNWYDGEKPTYKYGDIHWPSFHVVVDDCMNSALFAPSYHNPVANASIRNRHIGDVGASLHFAVQSYSSQNGLPRSLRENITCYMLWRMASEERRVQIAKELSSDVEKGLFLRMYDEATPPENEKAFMTLDFQAPRERRFRASFDKVLAPPPPK